MNMRIFDDKFDAKMNTVSLFLTKNEALHLIGYLEQFLAKPKDKGLHFHLSSEDYQKEITVCIYDPESVSALDPRSQKLILDDE
jgi:hypothetical protein